MKPRLKVIPTDDPDPIHIAQQWREDIRKRDWSRMHIEADKRPPVLLRMQRWAWSLPIIWRGR